MVDEKARNPSWFKPGQSGCPDGGHRQRRANKKAREEAEAAAEAERQTQTLADIVRAKLSERRAVSVDGVSTKMSNRDILATRIIENAVKGDARDLERLIKYIDRHGLEKAKPKGTGVLVVYEPMKNGEQWEKDSEGDHHLTKDPLEGLPGYDSSKPLTTKNRGETPD